MDIRDVVPLSTNVCGNVLGCGIMGDYIAFWSSDPIVKRDSGVFCKDYFQLGELSVKFYISALIS